ncbi:MAG: CHASE3 domain-containing protein [Candidatus Acidiferrales bacterium]
MARLSSSAKWVGHSYQVELAISDVEFLLSEAARARLNYVNSPDGSFEQLFDSKYDQTRKDLQNIRHLTSDNPRQQDLCDQLEGLANRRLAVLGESINLRKSGKIDGVKQAAFTRDNVAVAAEIDNVMQQMEHEEDALLHQRMRRSDTLFVVFLIILSTAFAVALSFFWIQYQLLAEELSAREQAEASAHRLSARVLRLQDEERRRLSRDLHDGLGQNLVAAKLSLSNLANSNPDDSLVNECLKAIDESLAEARTISYLLHPPLLDDIGIASAARWYVEGFSKRSGINVAVDIPDQPERMPHAAELALFRVLQESLTNIHRHAKASRAEVSLRIVDRRAVLRVRDYGTGIAPSILEHFLKDGTHVGVGLAGMQERVREQGGQFTIQSDETGSTIEVSMPLSTTSQVADEQAPTAAIESLGS